MTDKEAQALATPLAGRPAPDVELPWTTYADKQDLLGPNANTSLAELARRHTLVAYFFPSEDEEEGPFADTMSRVYRANDHEITQLQARTVGVSTQTALAQQQIALTELFPQLLLADDELRLADALQLPTTEVAGRDEYRPMAILIYKGLISHVIYPIASPRAHIAEVLAWLAERKTVRPTISTTTDTGPNE